MELTGKNRSTRGKTCLSATLSTRNSTWTDPGSNPDLRGERPATNRLSLDFTPSMTRLSFFILDLITAFLILISSFLASRLTDLVSCY
jgi:hypothetical protein